MGDATETLAERMGPATGSLLNATFGNAAELILGLAALRHGHVALVKGSLTGSILGNLLLVAGASIVAGGVKFTKLEFNRLAASSSVSTLFLAVVAMIVPTLLSTRSTRPLSEEISVVLIVMYGLTLLFSLRTHSTEMGTVAPTEAGETKVGASVPIFLLVAAAAATAVASELLVDSLGGTIA